MLRAMILWLMGFHSLSCCLSGIFLLNVERSDPSIVIHTALMTSEPVT